MITISKKVNGSSIPKFGFSEIENDIHQLMLRLSDEQNLQVIAISLLHLIGV